MLGRRPKRRSPCSVPCSPRAPTSTRPAGITHEPGRKAGFPRSAVAPVAFKGRLVQYAGRILRAHPGKATAEIHDYHDMHTGVLAASLAKRAPGYTNLGFSDPRRLSLTPSSPLGAAPMSDHDEK